MPVGFYEEMQPGQRFELGSHSFSSDDIKAFAARYDPQSFHLDEAAAEASPFGALCASGWHTVSVMMKLLVQSMQAEIDRRQAAGMPEITVGPSPGFEDLRWLKPVYVGDTLTFSLEVTGKRPLVSRPGWGLVFQQTTAQNQSGDLAFRMDGKVILKRRGA